ncbi:unnamed protein product [Adineta steineri]|uniref:Uncharacterized protein n=1 Tax=Adineta steineri TaxID=433720 RepID=A0A819KQY5_9BILA|nr:unnamed protein product [Adineta steineri]CAF3951148.1 unnamed protein product [Adineta steineri]
MFSKYFLLILGVAATVYIKTTNAYGVCSCMCCDGAGCEPRLVGTTQVPSCGELNCISSCSKAYPLACDSPSTGGISAPCQDVTTTTIHSGAFIVQESSLFITLLLSSLLLVTKIIF